jgi:hypothetical protein
MWTKPIQYGHGAQPMMRHAKASRAKGMLIG